MRSLVPLDAAVLHERSTPVLEEEFGTPALLAIVNELNEAFDDLFSRRLGVGLAAPQMGIGKQVFVAQDFGISPSSPAWAAEVGRRAFPRLLACNPEWVEQSGPTVTAWEVCLSEPGVFGLVRRRREVKLAYRDQFGGHHLLAARDWQARILQHEFDHLQGCMCSRHYLPGTATPADVYRSRWESSTLASALRGFGLEASD